MAYQILNPGMRYWFAPDYTGVVGYVVVSGYHVVAGAPICSPEQSARVAAAFEHDTRLLGRRVCYFGAQDRLAGMLGQRGPIARVLLGAQPVWEPGAWGGIVDTKASLRAQIARARNKGVITEIWPAEHATNHPALLHCLAEWLATRGLPPMHFLVESDTLSRLQDRQVFVAQRDNEVVGFAIASPIVQRNGWLIEQIVRGQSAPNGTAERLIDTMMRSLAGAGAGYVTLGLSPLSRMVRDQDEAQQPFWIKTLLAWTRAHGRRFYNFDGLDSFKAKLQPLYWEPVYAITNERAISLATLYAIAGAFGGISPVRFLSDALIRALAQELHWAERWVQHAVGKYRPHRDKLG